MRDINVEEAQTCNSTLAEEMQSEIGQVHWATRVAFSHLPYVTELNTIQGQLEITIREFDALVGRLRRYER